MMKNPYLYGYLPLFSIVFFSLTFGLYAMTQSIQLFQSIGVYAGMREFLSDFELRVFLLVLFGLFFFMLFSALKLIGETIHELGMLFFSKDQAGEAMHVARGGNIIFFFGSLVSAIGIQSIIILIAIFIATVLIYFIFIVYKMSNFMSFTGMTGIILFEIFSWTLLGATVLFVLFKLYNSAISSLPFLS